MWQTTENWLIPLQKILPGRPRILIDIRGADKGAGTLAGTG
jgi:hypothetical protein